ncbi:MAG TPA: hypothetical protein VGN34_02990 [Ktedonobacteraceae bacterium]|jgi:hypothetical protein
MQSTCHCGRCAWCQAKQAVLVFGQSIGWKAFPWLPGNSIAAGETYWHLFVDTHQQGDLERLLVNAGRQRPVEE